MPESPLDNFHADDMISLEEWKQRKQRDYEDRIVKLALKELGRTDLLRGMRQRARERTGEPHLTGHDLLDALPEFPLWLGARYIGRVFEDFTLTNLFNRYTTTRVFKRWGEVRDEAPDNWGGPVGLVFTTPKVRQGRGALIHHNMSVPLAEDGFQLLRRVRDTVFVTERFTDFLARLRKDEPKEAA